MSGSRTEKQKIVCLRVIALLAMRHVLRVWEVRSQVLALEYSTMTNNALLGRTPRGSTDDY